MIDLTLSTVVDVDGFTSETEEWKLSVSDSQDDAQSLTAELLEVGKTG